MPEYEVQKYVGRDHGEYRQKSFSCRDQFLAMAFAQFTYRESLRDIEACSHRRSSECRKRLVLAGSNTAPSPIPPNRGLLACLEMPRIPRNCSVLPVPNCTPDW